MLTKTKVKIYQVYWTEELDLYGNNIFKMNEILDMVWKQLTMVILTIVSNNTAITTYKISQNIT